MRIKVYIKNRDLFIDFHPPSLIYSGLQYPLGDALADFSMFPETLSKDVFQRFRDEFLLHLSTNSTDDEFFAILKQYVISISKMNAYFNFYMDTYVKTLLLMKEMKQEIPKFLKGFLLDNGAGIDIDGMDFSDIAVSSQWIAEVLIEDIKKRRNRLKEDFDFITNEIDNFDGLNPMGRLYLLSKQGRNYLSCEFRTTLELDYYLHHEENDIKTIRTALLKNKADVVEMVTINNLDELLSFELYHTLKTDLQLRKCKYCDEYFIVRGRIDTEYCDRIKENETKPCSLIGATRSYVNSKTGNPIYTEFQKAYKRNHSRRRVGKMTQTEFYEWSEEARLKRNKCEMGLLSLDEFVVWLGNKR